MDTVQLFPALWPSSLERLGVARGQGEKGAMGWGVPILPRASQGLQGTPDWTGMQLQ